MELPSENRLSRRYASLAEKFSDSLEILKKPHGLRAMLVYVEIGAYPSRLPPFQYLALAALGLCWGVDYLYRTRGRKDRVVLRQYI